MKIEKHISELLFRYNRIVVPGLGCFTCSHESVSVHPITHRFQPPNKRVQFDAQDSTDGDRLLARYIAKVEGMSEEQVNKGIADYVSGLKEAIQSGTGVALEKIGTLKLDDQDQLILKPDTETNVFAPAFGMAEFRSPAIERSKKPTKKKIVEPAPAPKPKVVKEKKERSTAWVKWVAILILLLGLFGVGYWKQDVLKSYYIAWFETPAEDDNQNAAEHSEKPGTEENTGSNYQARPDSSLAQLKDLEGADRLEAQVSGEELVPKAFETPKKPKVRKKPVRKYTAADIVVEYPDYYKEQVEYYLIAGCFVFIENAREYRNKLLRQGYESEIVGPGVEGCYRVSYGKYYLEEEALGRLNYIRSTINDGAWLLKR